MYRTDKQFMKNPATASSRVYVGGLAKTVIAEDLESKFSKYGKILGLSINYGFAFIQFETENEAQAAIKAENGSLMMGRKILVRQAFPPKGNKDLGIPPLLSQGNFGSSPRVETPQKAPPVQIGPTQPTPPPQNETPQEKLYFEPPERDVEVQEEEMDTGPSIRPPPPQKFDDDNGRKRGTRGGKANRGRQKSRDRFESQRDLPPRDLPGMYPEREDRPGGYYGGRGDFMDNYGPPHVAAPPPDVCPPPERNDCEIIVVSRSLTEYAEFIETKLKHIGLVVDLLFPNEDVPIGRVLANISSRGCLYAILVMPQNEEHRSLTLNILHGVPQEHRNMPLDDALILISRNFEAYMRGETLEPEDPNKLNLADQHPQPLQMLINLLAENRMLTTSQYDRILKYLQERRDMQHEHEVAEGITADSNESSSKQNELQSRILNILNKSNDTPIPTSITAPESTTSTKEDATLLKDPSVQKALDSLLSGEMFKSITGGM